MKKISILLVVLIFCIAGCGSSSKSESTVVDSQSGSAAYSLESPQAPEMAKATANPAADAKQEQGDRKIIKNAEVRLRVDDITAVAEKIKTKTAELQGYPNNFAVYSQGKNANADISLRVPTAFYGTLLDFIVDQGKAEYKREYTNDVTLEFIDLDSRVKVLKAEEESLLGLLNKAEKIDEILKIKAQITSTRGERESLEGQLKAISQSVEYATINVSLFKPENSEANVNIENLNIFSRSGRALIYGFNAMTGKLGDLIVFIFALLPTLALLGLVVSGVLYIRKGWRNRK